MTLRVLKTGPLTTPQDGGRPGHARFGIGRSGAADRPAFMLANQLVGNPADACVLEMTLMGPELQLEADRWLALTGAPLPQATIDDRPLPMWRPVHARAGSRLKLGGMASGCRSYLAVAGGIDVEPWLGSRACDVNAGLGPPPLAEGDRVPLGQPDHALAADDDWSLDPAPWFDHDADRPLRLLRSSHTRLLDEPSLRKLTSETFTLHADSNRVGSRLDGPRLALAADTEIISAGSVAGSVQLPPGGQPIVFGCEHPVSGGYPRIAQLIEADLPRMAQRRPGDALCFCWVSMDEALEARHTARALLAQMRRQINNRLQRQDPEQAA